MRETGRTFEARRSVGECSKKRYRLGDGFRVGSNVDGDGRSGGGDRGGVDADTRLVLGLAPAQRIQDLPQPTSENAVTAKFAEFLFHALR